jgi:hypothetical protein
MNSGYNEIDTETAFLAMSAENTVSQAVSAYGFMNCRNWEDEFVEFFSKSLSFGSLACRGRVASGGAVVH